MLIKICPSCKKQNPPDRLHCKFCGWKLPAVAVDPDAATPPVTDPQPPVIPDPPPAEPDATEPLSSRQTVIRTIPTELLRSNGKPEPEVASGNQQLAAEHAALADAHQQLTADHAALTDAHQQLQQDHQATLAQNRTFSSRISALEQDISQIPGLKQALALAKEEVAKLHSKPPEEIIKEVPQKISLARQVLTWAVPVVTAVGGMFAGVHTPLNTAKSQLGQTQTQLAETVQRLNAAISDGQHAKAAKTALEQQNGQLAGQLAADSAQQEALEAQRTQANQSSSAQLAATQRDLQATRASLAATAAQLQQVQRERAAADQRIAQLQAESTRKGSQLENAQNVISKHPLLNYHGPTEGNIVITYSAKNDKPANITIDHQHISGDGSLSINTMAGTMLPGVPVVVQASGTKRASIVDSPGPSNGWAKLTIRVEGKDQHQAMVHWSVPQ